MWSETTYVRPHDHCEAFARADGSDVYAFADSLPRFRGVRWVPGLNPLFRHADQPALALAYLSDRFIACD